MLQTEPMDESPLSSGADPESLLPSQWADLQRAAASSELRLMAAVMIDALPMIMPSMVSTERTRLRQSDANASER